MTAKPPRADLGRGGYWYRRATREAVKTVFLRNQSPRQWVSVVALAVHSLLPSLEGLHSLQLLRDPLLCWDEDQRALFVYCLLAGGSVERVHGVTNSNSCLLLYL